MLGIGNFFKTVKFCSKTTQHYDQSTIKTPFLYITSNFSIYLIPLFYPLFASPWKVSLALFHIARLFVKENMIYVFVYIDNEQRNVVN